MLDPSPEKRLAIPASRDVVRGTGTGSRRPAPGGADADIDAEADERASEEEACVW